MDPSFFGLSGHPFTKPAAPDSHCLADEHLALTTELRAGLKAPHGITLLIGDEGAGKSTFIRSFIGQLPDSFVVAYLPTAGPGLRHLLTEAVEQLGGTVVPGGGEQALIDVLRSLARARADHDRSTLVVIDDAHELPAKTIERLGKLFGSDPAEPSRLHVTLVGRPELLDRMNAANDRSILKHLVQVCRMDAIGPEDAFRYIADRVQKVGGIVDRLFTEDALRLIVQRANGNPARIDQICSAALERAADRGAAAVDTDAVDTACTGEATVESNSTNMVPSDTPEPPTYFFNEDDADADSAPATGPAASRDTLPASPPVMTSSAPAVTASANSRRRLAFWAIGAIAIVAAFAGMMTLPERTAVDTDGMPDADEPIVTAKADRRADKQQNASAASESKGDGTEQQSPIAVPKLVVRRNGEGGPQGARAAARKNAEEGRGSEGAVASGAAGASGAVSVPDAAAERPRFPAPPLGPAAAPSAVGVPPQAAPVPNQGIAGTTAPPGTAAPSAPASPPVQAASAPPTPAAAPIATPPPPAVVASPPPATPPSTPAAAVPAQQPAAKPTATDTAAAPKPGDAGLVAPTRANARPSAPVAAAAPKPAPTVVAKAAPPPATPSVAAASGPYTIQVGAFSSRANAEALVAKIRGTAPDGRIVASTADGKPVFRVVIGSFGSPAQAAPRSRELAKAGLSTFVRRAN
jgi:type II secretory pathway predicted ATPase ExeA